jgi:hypothetical protein
MIRADRLIWIDGIAGAVVGLLMLSLRGWLTDVYGLPATLLLGIGLANLAYAGVSLTLAQFRRPDWVPYLRVVAVANIAWSLVCLTLAVDRFDTATIFGQGQLLGEAVFVGGLGILEWRAARPGLSFSKPTTF